MAFNRQDTENLYERQIEPVLRRNGVTPVIINRRQSNDDLNNQIIRELLKCDFCIADLTYTRPSVYFEAGFAQRQVEVVYTARKDHLDPGAPDDTRVHFDLQQKPIITWARANDSTFGTRLEKRLRATVLRDWQSKQKANAARIRAEQQFVSMPVSERIASLQRKTIASFRSLGFGDWMVGDRKIKVRELLAGHHIHVQGIRRHRRAFEYVSVQSFATVNKSLLREMDGFYGSYRIQYRLSEADRRINQIHADHIVLCLQAIPDGRIESAITDLGRGLKQGQYQKIESCTPFRGRDDNGRIVEFIERWHFIGPIRSVQELDERLEEIRAQVG